MRVRLTLLQKLSQDVRQTLRRLRRAPGFALTAVLTLALGVGANVIVFGVLDAMLLRGLPDVPQPRQLSFLQHRLGGHNGTTFAFPQYQDLARQNRTFSGMGAYDMAPVGLSVSGHAEERWAYMVTGSYFDLLGVKPYLGRFFGAADDTRGEGGSPWVVLSYTTWKQEFGGDPGIIGRTVRISQHPLTVMGVAPPGFYGTERFLRPALWFDLWNEQQLTPYGTVHNRNMGNLWVIGRRKPGVTVGQAEADLNRVTALMARVYPQTDAGMQMELTLPGYVGDALRTPLKAFLTGLMLLAVLVLAAACANLGGLYAARATDRTREIAIRMALGSSRARVLGGLLLESAVLALIGGALGCLIARAALDALTNYRPPFDFPVGVAVDPGWAVYGFAVLLALACGLLCGMIPVRETRRADANQLMKGAVGAGVRGRRRWGLRDVLLLVEVALCCVLVTASFVSLRGLVAELHMPLGFNPHGVTRVAFNPTIAGYSDEQTRQFERRVLDGASALPGVESAALAGATPLDVVGGDNNFIYRSGVIDFRPENRAFLAKDFSVSPAYFKTAETRLLAGRTFTWADDEKSPEVAVVNQAFAKELFGERPAIGEFFQDGGSRKYRIIGIVEDGKYTSLNEPAAPAVFRTLAQEPWSHGDLLVRMAHPEVLAHDGRQANLDRALVGILHNAGPGVPVNDVGPWEASLAPVLFPTRAATVALGILGALALLLAVTGIFGLASYTIARRMREFGIRVALGAPRASILETALGRIGRILLFGSVAGLLLGLAGSRVLAAVVYGASATDPLVLIAVCATMLLIGLLSVALPARRAILVEPAILLRDE